jgi:hypothetical protein
MEKLIECKSEEGITIGLIDAIISIARILKDRDLSSNDIKEALLDLKADSDLKFILKDN